MFLTDNFHGGCKCMVLNVGARQWDEKQRERESSAGAVFSVIFNKSLSDGSFTSRCGGIKIDATDGIMTSTGYQRKREIEGREEREF